MNREKGRAGLGSIGRLRSTLSRDFHRNKYIYMMVLPVVAFYFIFHYIPMYGAIIAFKNFSPAKGILGSPWAGLSHFKAFFSSYYFGRLLRNTFLISIYDVIFGFPAPVILALLMNEIRKLLFKRVVQTVTYLPHFVSLVIVCGLIVDFLSRDGLINNMLSWFGIEGIAFLSKPEWFRTIFVSTNIWQEIGWGSIIYMAALSNIPVELYEAAQIDGAGRWRQTLSVTIPGLTPTIIILLLLRMGKLMTVAYEKVLLLYNPLTYETADVIQTFVYRKGILEASFSYSAAAGLFNSVINFALLFVLNRISKRVSETSLW
jgi:putative aldouronate transport system permease protein